MKQLNPPHLICNICKDDGGCLNNETHKDYEKNNKDFFGTDYWDCSDYLEKKNNTQGQTMKNYIKNLQEEEKNKEPYVSDFVKWSKEYS
jgi:hypothetical protein